VVYQAWNIYNPNIKFPPPRTVLKPFNTLDNVIDARFGGSRLDEVTNFELESVLRTNYNRKRLFVFLRLLGKLSISES